MNENPVGVATVNSDLPQDVTVNQSRRRLGTLGVTGSVVLMSLSSKSAVAGWGSCTGSELASGNLSKTGTANPCGCSPGFWWNSNGAALRGTAPSLRFYPFTLEFNAFFECNFLVNAGTIFQNCGPGANPEVNPAYKKTAPTSTAMHAIAALLNAAYYGARYPVVGMQNPADVKAAFKRAFGNNDFTAFVNQVDVYKSGVWCNGTNE